MANCWLREIVTSATGTSTGLPFAARCYANFLSRILGFTNYSESAGFLASTKSGTDGEFNLTGTDKNFRDSVAGSFVSGDTNKWIVIADPVRHNAGIYKATYSSASTVAVDFRSAAAEYPTQTTGLSWWLLDPSVGITSGNFTCRTPHAYGWEIEFTVETERRFRIRIATDGDWNGTKILGPVYFGSSTSKVCRIYAHADDEGKWIAFLIHQSTNNYYPGVLVANILPFDTGYTDTELVALHGCTSASEGSYAGDAWLRNRDVNKVGHGYVWNERLQSALAAYMADYTYSGYTNSFVRWSSRQVNSRTGKNDLIDGTNIFVDENNELNAYEIRGQLVGHYSGRANIGQRSAFDVDGTKDKLHWSDGYIIDWPGWTPQV